MNILSSTQNYLHKNQTLPFGSPKEIPSSKAPLNLKARTIHRINACEAKLDKLVPNFAVQNSFDKFWKEIDLYESCLPKEFHEWIYHTGKGAWNHQLAVFLAKLPVRVAYNVLHNYFTLIKLIVTAPMHAVMHPMKIPLRIAKLLVELVNALSQPETWSRIGMGLMGSSLATAAVSGNPLSPIAFGIGAALSFAGISIGTLKAALLAAKGKGLEQVKGYLLKEAKHLPEDMLTSFGMVLLLEGIQQAMRGIQRTCQRISRSIAHSREVQESQSILRIQQFREFMEKYGLPKNDYIDSWGTSYRVAWRLDRAYLQGFLDKMPQNPVEGKFFLRDLIDHYDYQTVTYWSPGYYDANGSWCDGYWDFDIISVPVYEKFAGYDLNLVGWQEPAWPPLPPAMSIHREAHLLQGVTPVIANATAETRLVNKDNP